MATAAERERDRLAAEREAMTMTPAAKARGKGLVYGLAALVVLLVIAIILLAVLLPKQSSSGGGGTVPHPSKAKLQGFSTHQEPGWQCPTRYRCQFQGNSSWSDPSSWTPFVSPVATPAYNWAPLLEVDNASGQAVRWQRQVGAPQSNVTNANRDDGHTGWLDCQLQVVDATHFVDQVEPCGSGPRLLAPMIDGWQETPDDPHIWCGTSYSVAKTDSTNVWSQWSPFFEPPQPVGPEPDPDPQDPYPLRVLPSFYPVLRVDSASSNLIFRRRTSPDDHLGQVLQLAQVQPVGPELPETTLWLDSHVPQCGGPGAPGPTRR